MVENANCPKDQYMVVKTASYRGLSGTKTCGLSDDYSCEVNVTNLVKKQCDGQHECNMTVDDRLFSRSICPGLTKYIYFEYQCTDRAISYNESNVPSGPRVLIKMSSGDIKAKEGDLVNLLCSAQGEPPITFSWEKDQKPLESLTEIEKPHRSSLLVVTLKDQTSFGKYVCNIQDRFETNTHTISVQKLEDTITVQTMEDRSFKIVLIVIGVLAALLIISLGINVHLICKHRRQKTNEKNLDNKHDRNIRKVLERNPNINDDDGNYENVELDDEQSTYAALRRTGDETDDKYYTHLNKEPEDHVKQEDSEYDYVIHQETGQDYVIRQETGQDYVIQQQTT